jgi:hypothetical protein
VDAFLRIWIRRGTMTEVLYGENVSWVLPESDVLGMELLSRCEDPMMTHECGTNYIVGLLHCAYLGL